MAGGKRITLRQIAELTGTSIGTVERALKGRQGVKPSTQTRVLAVARELGYVPVPGAALARKLAGVRLAIIYPEQPIPFYLPMTAGINDAANDLRATGLEVELLRYPLHRQEMEDAVLETLDAAAFQGVAINVAGAGAGRHIDRITAMGVPVITFNTDLPGTRRRFFVGRDSAQSGRMGAALLGRFLCGSGTVTVLGNYIRETPFIERFGGFADTMQAEFPGIRIHPGAECFAEKRLAAQALMDVLHRVPDIRGVFCTGYTSTMGAISALRQLGRRDVVLIGYDTSEELLAALRDDWCDALLFQDPYRQGYAAVTCLAQYVLEGRLPEERKICTPTSIVIRQNADSYR